MVRVVTVVGTRARGGWSVATFGWTLVMAVVLALGEARPAGRGTDVIVGLVASAVLGLILGWRRRLGAVLAAPLLSWLVAWLPLLIAAMVRHGVLAGLVVGALTVTVGWIAIGGLELAVVGLVAVLVARLRPGGPAVVILGPER
ncbi:MAG: hypothetical protein ACP5OV_08390 [Acidimicrobiales bacterium]